MSLLQPLFAYGFTDVVAQASCAIFARDILTNLFLHFLIMVVVTLVGALYVLGVCDLMFIGLLDMWVSVGNI